MSGTHKLSAKKLCRKRRKEQKRRFKMMKNIILILLLLFVSEGLFGQYVYKYHSYEPEIIDGRAEALGSTSILSSSGANYVFNNPAMLSSLDSYDFQFSLRTKFGKSNTTYTIKDTVEYYTVRSYTDYVRTFHYKINGLSCSMPFNLPENSTWKIGFAAGYRTYYDWGYNLHQKEKHSNEIPIEEEDREYNGGFNTLVLGSGISYKKKIFGGFSISLPFLSEYSKTFEAYDGSEATDSGTLKGTFFTLSGSYILNNYLILGARFRTQYKLENEGEYSYYHNQYKYKYTIPAEYGLALEVKPFTNIKIFTEYITRNLADYDGINYFYTESEDGYSFRTGFEIGTSNLFRGGFFMQSVPVYKIISYYDEFLNNYVFEYDKKPQNETGFTAGFGTQIKYRIQLNLFSAYSFLYYDESFNNVIEGVDISHDVSYYLFKIGCSLGYSF